ncbi:MAG: hypothetical protein IPQ26_09610 [Elusimicrobia bacterium]|nr:hypothetical protein [Elusimicrobiota bacterium]
MLDETPATNVVVRLQSFPKPSRFCDGSHKPSGTGLTPVKVTVETAGKVAWCACKHSKRRVLRWRAQKNLNPKGRRLGRIGHGVRN